MNEKFMVFLIMARDFVSRADSSISLAELVQFAVQNNLYLDDKGFFIYSVYKDELWVHYVYCAKVGDMVHIDKMANIIAKQLGLHKIKILTKHPKALERKLGFHQDEILMVKEVI